MEVNYTMIDPKTARKLKNYIIIRNLYYVSKHYINEIKHIAFAFKSYLNFKKRIKDGEKLLDNYIFINDIFGYWNIC